MIDKLPAPILPDPPRGGASEAWTRRLTLRLADSLRRLTDAVNGLGEDSGVGFHHVLGPQDWVAVPAVYVTVASVDVPGSLFTEGRSLRVAVTFVAKSPSGTGHVNLRLSGVLVDAYSFVLVSPTCDGPDGQRLLAEIALPVYDDGGDTFVLGGAHTYGVMDAQTDIRSREIVQEAERTWQYTGEKVVNLALAIYLPDATSQLSVRFFEVTIL